VPRAHRGHRLLPVDRPTFYRLSFTAAALRPELARIVAEIYLAERDWGEARRRILSSNSLQCRTSSSAVRLERELRQRLKTLTHRQIILLVGATAEDRAAAAWLAACKRFPLAFEFAAEVLREKLEAHDPVLRRSDYEEFVEQKALSHPELVELTNSSKSKVRQVLLRMLVEAGLLRLGGGAALGTIQRPVVSPEVVQAIAADDPHWFAAFLVPDAEIAPRARARRSK
jgi:Putative inner membrane protein (DUF1819)